MHYIGLAIVHHLLVFGLAIMLAMELAYLRSEWVPVKRLSGLDAGYGALAVLVLLAGAARVLWGDKGWVFYQDNPYFWAKVGTFLLIGLLSVPPTLLFLKWRKAFRADAAFQPDATEVARAARFVRFEVLLLFPLVAFAAAMARWTS